MWKKQWKELLGNRVLLISVIVLLFIPIMYAGTFLGSIWDPYGKTENLKIAVINEDKPVEMEGKKLDVGDQLVSNLKKNDSFDWQFVSNKEEANKELRTGDYYMIITIPKDFSKNASTVLDKKPKEMQLNYTTNPGKIMTGDLLGTQGATAVNQTISESVTEQYSKTIFTVIEKMGDGFGEASNASDKLAKGTNTVKDGNKKIATNLEKMADSTLTFQSGSKKLVVGVDALQSGVSQLNTGATKLNTGIGTYTNGVDQLASGSNKLVAGADQLTANSGALNNGASSLANGLSQLQTGSSALQNGVGAVADGNKQLSDGLGQLAGKTPELVDGINQLAEGQKSLTANLGKLQAGSEKIATGLEGLPKDEQIKQLTDGLNSVQKNMNALNSALNGQNAGISTDGIQKELENIKTNLQSLGGTLTTSPEAVAVQKTETFKNMTDAQKADILGALQAGAKEKGEQQGALLKATQTSLQNVATQLSAAQTALGQLDTLKENVAKLNEGINKVNPGAVQAISGYTKLREEAAPGARTVADGLGLAEAGSEKLQAGAEQLQASAPTLTGAINSASAASQKLADGASKANAGVGQLATGINSAADGSQTLNNGLSTYTAGVGTLGNGVSTLNGGASKLAANSGQLQSGASQLATGTNQLAEKTPELASGVGQLNEGAGKLHDGATQLADGSNKLTDGLTKVSDGTIKLGDTLGDASTKVSDTNLNPANAKMISKPTDLNHTEISKVPNYGHGLAPYVIALALFVGALTFNVIFPIEVPVAYPKTAVSWWFSKFSVLVVHAVAQALLLDVIMLLFLGLEVDHVGQFVMITVFTSLAYMSIVAFLAITLGNPGRFIAMVLLVIQLGASAGTFPLPLTNGFFQAMHPFMPMTYAVNGYRQAMTSGLSNGVFWQTMGVMVGIVIVFNALLIAVLHLQRKKNYRLDPNEN